MEKGKSKGIKMSSMLLINSSFKCSIAIRGVSAIVSLNSAGKSLPFDVKFIQIV